MEVKINTFALAARVGDAWGVSPLGDEEDGEIEPGDYVVAVRSGGDVWGLLRAYPPEVGEFAMTLRVGDRLMVVRLFGGEEEEEPPEETPKPPEDCSGPHPMCSRIPCYQWLRTVYYLSFSGFGGEAGAGLNGAASVVHGDDCVWRGAINGWSIRLEFPWYSGAYKWLCSLESPDGDRIVFATGGYGAYCPEGEEFFPIIQEGDVTFDEADGGVWVTV